MVLVMTLRWLLNEEAAALYMARREEEENESQNQNGCALCSFHTANKQAL